MRTKIIVLVFLAVLVVVSVKLLSPEPSVPSPLPDYATPEKPEKSNITLPKIVWTSEQAVRSKCADNISGTLPEDIGACYDHEEKTIYMSKIKIEGVESDFILYHEIAHSIYWIDGFPKDIFKKSNIFNEPAFESMADSFALWIYKYKYPEEKYLIDILLPEKVKFFESTCNKACIAEILNLEVK